MTLPDVNLFRAYDIRGCAQSLLTPEVAHRIAAAFGERVRQTGDMRVVLGRDGRLSSPGLHAAVSDALFAAGLDVIDIGLVPTPLLYFAEHYFKCGNGIMITGSHNPKHDNGFKLSLDNAPFFGNELRAFRHQVKAVPKRRPGGRIRQQSVVDAYIVAITESVQLERGLDIAIDCGNGATGSIAAELYRALGCTVATLFDQVDGNFPNHHPDPAVAENLLDLSAKVRTGGYAIGLAFDGDGDRLGVVDNLGRHVLPDRLLMLFADDVLKNHPGAPIAFDVKCSRQLNTLITKAGGRALYCKTGHANLKSCARAHNTPLAGELSGHILFADRWFGFDDALYAGARMLELLARCSEPLAYNIGRFPQSYVTDELLLDCGQLAPHKITNALVEHATFDGASLLTLDGLRVDFDDGWGLVRASNTTANLVLRFEGNSRSALYRIRDKILSALQKVAPEIDLPNHVRNADAINYREQ